MKLKRSPLYSVYKDSARLIEFAGWELPVYFKGIKEEHLAVRNQVGLFDISHMGEIRIKGKDAFGFVQRVFCNDFSKIKPGKAQYGAFLNFEGGMIDDVIGYLFSPEEIFFCVNSANTEKDYQWLLEQKTQEQVEIINQSQEYAELALQGPKAEAVLARLVPEVAKIPRFGYLQAKILSKDSIIARTGYTGEDGFEIFYPEAYAIELWQALLERGKEFGIEACGLGARDTLRLEMGYPLHGHDISEKTTPLEADLAWIVGWNKNFIGKEKLLVQKNLGIEKKRVGLEMQDKGIAREGYPIVLNGKEVGKITSGTKTPSLDKPIAMGYVPKDLAKPGQELKVKIRDEEKKLRVVSMPFYKKIS
ncbi:MAG: glycine cleavage system aminomethyltransferase GcvT [Candidatus Omnitrophica bacterium]|nr:glycine cleavage system aminomethyltransferase GcvT [Candidatus Omnitrophota bacterium]